MRAQEANHVGWGLLADLLIPLWVVEGLLAVDIISLHRFSWSQTSETLKRLVRIEDRVINKRLAEDVSVAER